MSWLLWIAQTVSAVSKRIVLVALVELFNKPNEFTVDVVALYAYL